MKLNHLSVLSCPCLYGKWCLIDIHCSLDWLLGRSYRKEYDQTFLLSWAILSVWGLLPGWSQSRYKFEHFSSLVLIDIMRWQNWVCDDADEHVQELPWRWLSDTFAGKFPWVFFFRFYVHSLLVNDYIKFICASFAGKYFSTWCLWI